MAEALPKAMTQVPDEASVIPVPQSLAQTTSPAEPAQNARPDDPRAAKVYSVFETHCARCHQTGRTERPLPSGGIGNILSPDELARDPALVRPGLPDASRLYDVFVTRHLPLDVYSGSAETAEPRPEDIQTVREWITELQPNSQSCPARTPIDNATIERLVSEAQQLERDGVKDLRFISLAHLYNACATGAEMAAYRQALTKLLNSLTWSPEPVKLTALDPDATLYSFRLSDLGWVAEHWDRLQKAYPAMLPNPVSEDAGLRAGTARPVLNGDWLAAAAATPPLYYELLRLPATLNELAKSNGVDINRNIRSGAVRRAALSKSNVTRANRIAERHAGALGGFWLIYDFATSTGDQDVLTRPLGPKPSPESKTPFKPDQIRAIFPLPNGHLAFALFDADGNRIERVLPGLEKPFKGDEAVAIEPGTMAGANCLACHADGIKTLKDEFRPLALAAPSVLSNVLREAALPLFPGESEMALLIAGDSERYHTAQRNAGVDPSLRIAGQEIVTALASRYQSAAGFETALAESGLARDAFLSALSGATGLAAPLARRLQHGVLPRADLERLFAVIKGVDGDAQTTGENSGGFLRDVPTEIGLSVWLDSARPASGDLVSIKAQSDTNCYLTIVSVDDERKATVIFPNDFEPDNLLLADRALSVPSPTAPYQLRFKSGVAETLIARCSISPDPPMGIEHDFERQRFTLLGNWEVFIQDTLATEAELRSDPQKAARAKSAQAEALKRRRALGERIEQRATTVPGRSLRDGRAVLVVGGT